MAEQPGASPPKREHWNSRLGVILAVAGSAVGLGNFLRFPGQAVQHGGSYGGVLRNPELIEALARMRCAHCHQLMRLEDRRRFDKDCTPAEIRTFHRGCHEIGSLLFRAERQRQLAEARTPAARARRTAARRQIEAAKRRRI